jgi:oxygen-independent coproporphyrinogen-3 oxidase
LTVHEGTLLYYQVKKNQVVLTNDHEMVDLYIWTVSYLAHHGFEQYEISNFAKPGYESRHNQVYWSHKPYKAFGVGACEFDGAVRCQNEKHLMKYMERIEQDQPVTTYAETLTPEQIRLEKIMLGLRRKKGLALDFLLQDKNEAAREQTMSQLSNFKAHHFLTYDQGYVVLTPTGLAVQNDIAVTLSM